MAREQDRSPRPPAIIPRLLSAADHWSPLLHSRTLSCGDIDPGMPLAKLEQG
jgi:hypothetical protein